MFGGINAEVPFPLYAGELVCVHSAPYHGMFADRDYSVSRMPERNINRKVHWQRAANFQFAGRAIQSLALPSVSLSLRQHAMIE